MASTLAPSPLHFCKMFTNFSPFHLSPDIAHISRPKMKLRHANPSHVISQQMHFHNCNGSRRSAHKAAARGGGGGADDSESEHRAVEAVLKLYEAIKNKNIHQLSDVIAEECSCVSNFVSAFQPILGKKQVLGFFLCLMKCLGNNIEFVVQQTLDEGMAVGVSWKLGSISEWSKAPLRLGKGFSFYTCHVYQGKVMIRNVEMFLEPVFHLEPLRMKLMSLVMVKLNPQTLLEKSGRKAMTLFFLFLLVAAAACLFKYRVTT